MNTEQWHARVQWVEIEKIFNSISDLISIHDLDFRIVRANSALCSFLGMTENELIGKTCFSMFHASSVHWPNCPHAGVLVHRAPVTELIEDDRIGAPLLVTCSPVYDERDRLLGSVHVARDVSKEHHEKQQRETAIARMRETLAWLQGLGRILTICSSCKRICNEEGEWQRFEKYLADHAGTQFSHGMCPSCFRKLFPGVGNLQSTL